jgi:hypothetical protein
MCLLANMMNSVLQFKRGEFDLLKHAHIQSAGMQTFIENTDPFEVAENLTITEDIDNADFRTQILVTADKGKKISYQDIVNLLDEQKRTGESMAKLSKKLKDVNTKVFITPGDGVPQIAKRSPKKPR